MLATHVVAPRLPELSAAHPGIVLELIATPQILDLARGDADLALRIVAPEQSGMIVKRVGRVALGVYASAAYLRAKRVEPAEAHRAPLDLLVDADSPGQTPEAKWLARAPPNAGVVLRTRRVGAVRAACAAGAGGASCRLRSPTRRGASCDGP